MKADYKPLKRANIGSGRKQSPVEQRFRLTMAGLRSERTVSLSTIIKTPHFAWKFKTIGVLKKI